MSGRGVVEVSSHSRTFSTQAGLTPPFFYDPVLGWCELSGTSVLHKNVDVLKSAGVGPGNSFALAYDKPLGLIPCAVGGTTLEEWTSDYVCWPAPENAKYHPGCHNLLSSTFRSLWLSGSDFKLTGILFYQGESDCSLDISLAETYGKRFNRFVKELRTLLGLAENLISSMALSATDQHPPKVSRVIPFLSCVVTSTRQLPHLSMVRRQQNESKMDHVVVIDTMGCSLQPDEIHLDSVSLCSLGSEMARQMMQSLSHLQTVEAEAQPGFITQGVGDVNYATVDMRQIPIGTLNFLDSSVEMNLAEVFHRAMSKILSTISDDETLFSSTSIIRSQSGIAPVNFVSGQVFFLDFLRVLRMLPSTMFKNDSKDRLFVDLGCGIGSCMSAALLFGLPGSKGLGLGSDAKGDLRPRFSKIKGFEMMHSKVVECRLLMNAILDCAKQYCSLDGTQSVDVVETNFLQADWSHANVVYACATCFDESTMRVLEEHKFPLLQSGACVIVIDKMLSPGSSLQLLSSCQVRTTWGEASARVFVVL